MTRRIAVVLWLCGLVLAGRPALAQDEAADLLAAMRDAYERLDYPTAERRALDALDALDALSPDQLVEVHTTLGLILHGRGEPLGARAQFEAALSLDPSLTLDPVLVSPKTLAFFEEVRAEAAAGQEAERAPTIRYVRIRDSRPAALTRSLVLPGWGQLYKGEPAKGWVLVGLWGATAAGTVAAHVFRSEARSDYLAATDPAEIAERYDDFNAWHRRRTALALGAAAVWAVAAFDVLAFGGPEGRVPDDRAVQFGFVGGSSVGIRVSF